MSNEPTLVADYLSKFHCIGPQCEDFCCTGAWKVTIDRETYRFYKQNKHPKLAPLFKSAVVLNPNRKEGNNAYGLIAMNEQGECPFLDSDRYCTIHKYLGEKALCDTCAIYPRLINRFGNLRELSLSTSCPEAARIVLLPEQPIGLHMAEGGIPSGRKFLNYAFPTGQAELAPEALAQFNELRALVLTILQERQLSIGSRLMIVGSLMERLESLHHQQQLLDAQAHQQLLQEFMQLLQNASAVEAEYRTIPANLPFKLSALAGILSKSLLLGAGQRFGECISDALELFNAADSDVTGQYQQAYRDHYWPYFESRQHILENYLVNQAFSTVFPFGAADYRTRFRELVGNLALLRLLLVGMAGKHQGLNDELVIKLFQSYSKRADHSRVFLTELLTTLSAKQSDSLPHMLLLLRDEQE